MSIVSEDQSRLACVYDGDRFLIAHHAQNPKLWTAGGWKRMHSRHPYIRLFSQVVFDEDVTMRLSEREVPWWLRAAPRQQAARKAYRSRGVPRDRSYIGSDA